MTKNETPAQSDQPLLTKYHRLAGRFQNPVSIWNLLQEKYTVLFENMVNRMCLDDRAIWRH